MSRILLDASAYSMLRRGHAAIQSVVQGAARIHVSPVMLGELWAGFRKGTRTEENARMLRRFLKSPRVEVIPITAETAECYAHILDSLRRAGTPIGVNDLWIAAGAMEHGLEVLTADAHYRVVPQIRVQHYGA